MTTFLKSIFLHVSDFYPRHGILILINAFRRRWSVYTATSADVLRKTGPQMGHDQATNGPRLSSWLSNRARQPVWLFARTLSETATRQRDKLPAAAIKGADDERAGRSRPNLVTRPDPTTALKETELRPQSGRLFHTYYRLSTTSLCRSTADSGRRRLCQHGRPTALPPVHLAECATEQSS